MLQSPTPIWKHCKEYVQAPSEAPLSQMPCHLATVTPRGSTEHSGDPRTLGLRAATHSVAVTARSRVGSTRWR